MINNNFKKNETWFFFLSPSVINFSHLTLNVHSTHVCHRENKKIRLQIERKKRRIKTKLTDKSSRKDQSHSLI